jgi:hypothetical protein
MREVSLQQHHNRTGIVLRLPAQQPFGKIVRLLFSFNHILRRNSQHVLFAQAIPLQDARFVDSPLVRWRKGIRNKSLLWHCGSKHERWRCQDGFLQGVSSLCRQCGFEMRLDGCKLFPARQTLWRVQLARIQSPCVPLQPVWCTGASWVTWCFRVVKLYCTLVLTLFPEFNRVPPKKFLNSRASTEPTRSSNGSQRVMSMVLTQERCTVISRKSFLVTTEPKDIRWNFTTFPCRSWR